MSTEKFLGKILEVKLGFDERGSRFGPQFTLGFEDQSQVTDNRVTIAEYAATPATVTPEVWSERHFDNYRFLYKAMKDAKAQNITDLIGKPVEITLNGPSLSSWRILTEVL
jgi:hypothetical protein